MTASKVQFFIEYLTENRSRRKKHRIESEDRERFFESKKQERQRLKKEKEHRLLNPRWESTYEIEMAKKEVKKGQANFNN